MGSDLEGKCHRLRGTWEPSPELAELTSNKIGLPGIDYKGYTVGSEWRYPDFKQYREKLESEEREHSPKKKEEPDWKNSSQAHVKVT